MSWREFWRMKGLQKINAGRDWRPVRQFAFTKERMVPEFYIQDIMGSDHIKRERPRGRAEPVKRYDPLTEKGQGAMVDAVVWPVSTIQHGDPVPWGLALFTVVGIAPFFPDWYPGSGILLTAYAVGGAVYYGQTYLKEHTSGDIDA